MQSPLSRRHSRPPTTTVAPALPPDTELLGGSAASPGPDPDLPLGELTQLHLVMAGAGEVIEWDLDTLEVTQHRLALDPDGPAPSRLFVAPGQLLVWPARGGALVSVVPGRPGPVETVATGVIDVQPGWSNGSVVVRTRAGVGELGPDGRYHWGPAEPPDEIDGRLMGATQDRAYLFGERLRTWGATDRALDAPAEIGQGGFPVAFGPYGPVWLASNGTLNVPLGGEDLRLAAEGLEPGLRWIVQGAAVAPSGRVALTIQAVGNSHPSSLVIVEGDGTVHREVRVRAALLQDRPEGHAPLTRLRWSADGRWLLLADETYSTVVAYRPDRGRAVVLPPSPMKGANDAVLVRVSR